MNKKVYLRLTGCAITLLLFNACKEQGSKDYLKLEVSNKMDFSRTEVVAMQRSQFAELLDGKQESAVRIIREGSGETQRTQWIDNNADGEADELLFMAEVAAGDATRYRLVIDSTLSEPESKVVAYSRFVPERTDDYTWENDKVAFRTYGPTGQREALEGVPGSTLSSGIDIWFKRTDESIIDKWYSEHLKSPGYYHEDHGEGYDPYHVGASRGTGGSGIWVEDSLHVSQNFTAHRTIADGPLRTVFELDYDSWSAFGVKETKRITLDLGTHFSKFEVTVESDKALPNYAAGISLHNNEGQVSINEEKGWVRHWETIDGAGVGEALVMDPAIIDSAFAHRTPTQDQSNLLVLLQPEAQKVTYYAGFAWEKAGEIETEEAWEAHLEKFSSTLREPLTVEILTDEKN